MLRLTPDDRALALDRYCVNRRLKGDEQHAGIALRTVRLVRQSGGALRVHQRPSAARQTNPAQQDPAQVQQVIGGPVQHHPCRERVEQDEKQRPHPVQAQPLRRPQ